MFVYDEECFLSGKFRKNHVELNIQLEKTNKKKKKEKIWYFYAQFLETIIIYYGFDFSEFFLPSPIALINSQTK